MSGIISRTKYDNDYNVEFVNQQTNEGNYRLDNNYCDNNNKCHSLFGPRQNKNNSNTEISSYNIIDRKEIENYLKNLDMPTSRSMNYRTLNDKNNKLSEFIKSKQLNIYNECNDLLNINDTRLDKDIRDFKSVNINRFEYPIIDPLNFVFNGIPKTEQIDNDRNGINSRLKAKDNFKMNK